jgi:molybdate transport system ATP-binding protein
VKQLNPYQVVEGVPDPSKFAAQREEVVELLGIEALLEKDLQQISNGERRKVLLARALLKSPKLLILDNPFTGLDAGFRDRLERIIGHLIDGELRIILVTNGRDELPPGVTHVLLMNHHGVAAQGPKEAILRGLSGHQLVIPGLSERAELPALMEEQEGAAGEQSQVLVHMEKVSVSYNGAQILTEVDWTVRTGEHWALLGPNGAGKTTLLSLILGDNPHAYANDITLFGKRRGSGESIWDIKRQIGWVAPELHLYYPKNIPCLDLVCSGFFDSVGRYHKCSADQNKMAMGWLQRLRMQQCADRSFGGLSEGEQRMILIARALVKHPALLILDEPCQGLDAANRDRVLQAVETIGDHTGATIIYVTHQGDALPSIITHMLRLDRGRVAGRVEVDNTDNWRVSHG